ncbi:zinc finger protein 585B [Drosophila willistoni]|uniref:zinc finger protein 585B n=1 Tax=Drosophila willistoni TaxID=7260 RepID=UPI00017D7729|nr:zinc finger protein 585B [Drosophila willistoni]
MADQQTGMEMSSSSSSGDLCLLCLENLAGSTDVDFEKLHLAAGMLQKLFQCYQIKVDIKDLPGCICDHCMAEVLKMCDNLRSWGEAQGRLQSQETGISDEEENEEEEEGGGHNESEYAPENENEAQINEGEEDNEEDTVVDVESIDWAGPIDSDYEALDDLLSEEYVESPEVKYDPDSVAELDIDALVLANNGGIFGKLVTDRTDMYCYYCHMVFHGGTKLRHHCIYDHSQLHYACFDCGETFLDSNQLHIHQADKQHQTTVVNNQEKDDDTDGGGGVTVAADDNDEESSEILHYRCQKCGQIFDRVYSILRHERDVHRNPENYECNDTDCRRVFDTKRGYSIHMKKHVKRLGSTVKMVKTDPTKPPTTSPTPGNFPCPMKHCQKTFQTRAQLAYHKITHSGEEFYCIICSKRLSSRSNMRRHIRTVHNPLQQEQKKRRRQDVTCELEGIGDDDDIMLELVEQQRKMDDVLQSHPDSQLPPLTSPAFIVIGNSSNNFKNTKKLQGGQFISLK